MSPMRLPARMRLTMRWIQGKVYDVTGNKVYEQGGSYHGKNLDILEKLDRGGGD